MIKTHKTINIKMRCDTEYIQYVLHRFYVYFPDFIVDSQYDFRNDVYDIWIQNESPIDMHVLSAIKLFFSIHNDFYVNYIQEDDSDF